MAAALQTDVDSAGYDQLMQQIIDKNHPKLASSQPEITSSENSDEAPKSEVPVSKKFTFRKGDQTFDVDEDAEFEMMADKKSVKLTLKELKERAAGDIAVKNRMHSLAEEKKRVQATLKEFATLSKDDPLGALEYIAKKVNESDSEFAYDKYLTRLAEQAEKIGNMSPEERKSWELQKKLTKAEQDLSQKDRESNVALRKQEILERYPEIGDQQFGQMVDAVLSNPALSEGIENEEDLFEKTEELIAETLTQKAIVSAFREIDPKFKADNELIFTISDQLRQNSDLDEDDLRDIIRDVIGQHVKQEEPVENKKLKEAQAALSQRQRAQTPRGQLLNQGASDYDLLVSQLMERKNSKLRGKSK